MTETGKKPWLSVVTVVMNDTEGYLATEASLFTQKFTDFEWITIDSSDEPLNARDWGNQNGVKTKYAWATSEGVFSAMNLGLKLSEAPYIYFLNAGDFFKDSTVLQKIFDSSQSLRATTALYGDVCFVGENGSEVVPEPFVFEAERSNYFCKGRFPPHQGTFTPRESLIGIGGFDETLNVAGDYKAFIDLSRKIPYLYVPIEVAVFKLGGVSSKKRLQGIWEFHQARKAIYQPRGREYLREFICTLFSYLKYFAFGAFKGIRNILN